MDETFKRQFVMENDVDSDEDDEDCVITRSLSKETIALRGTFEVF